MITHYDKIKDDIEELYGFLNGLSIDASFKSHLENDYLTALDFVEKYRNGGKADPATAASRDALGGLHELYKWIWSVKGCEEFSKLIPHLKMLSESAIRINSTTPMISPVTGKQDDKTNKLIETITAMYAIKIGTDVDIDDPIASSGGSNPDIIFSYQSKRIAFACKTLRGTSTSTVLDNLRSAAKQIDRAKCDAGYIAINAMNILPHSEISHAIFSGQLEPLSILMRYIETLYGALKQNSANELVETFASGKVRPVILTFMHSNTRLTSQVGNVSTMLKATCATEMIDGTSTNDDFSILNGVNDFIHNRL